MITVKQAVDQVAAYLNSIGDLVPRGEPRLEEFEQDDFGNWELTFSFEDSFSPQRIYRKFYINSLGEVTAMKIVRPGSGA